MGALVSIAASAAVSCCASCACMACQGLAGSISRRSARIAYCGLFALALLVAWIMRDYAQPLLQEIPWINVFDMKPSREWFGTQAVLRVTFGSFAFFSAFALLLIGVKDQREVRDSWHHKGWMIKFILFCAAIVLSFLLPNGVIQAYGSVARFGSGIFLLVQVIILLDFTYAWNEAWVAKDEQRWYIALLVVSVACYVAVIVGAVFMFHWFVPGGEDCPLNSFYITSTILLAFIFTLCSLHPEINGSLLPASVISVYCTYLCWSALSSEPRDYKCNGLARHLNAVSSGALITGLITTLLAVIYSAVRAGSSTSFLDTADSPAASHRAPLLSTGEAAPGGDDEDDESDDEERGRGGGGGHGKGEKPVRYVYSFFHVVFALASMYSAMLLTGWGNAGREGKDIIDVGWPSVYVKIGSLWITAGLYVWTLVAPLIFPDREFA